MEGYTINPVGTTHKQPVLTDNQGYQYTHHGRSGSISTSSRRPPGCPCTPGRPSGHGAQRGAVEGLGAYRPAQEDHLAVRAPQGGHPDTGLLKVIEQIDQLKEESWLSVQPRKANSTGSTQKCRECVRGMYGGGRCG
ncbi:hypothetical protein Bbelb_364820 [Branchiostoma belcheri]|nr:hypothetical protein Bbelb_364820 [Branchiostoma belcheri]